MRELRQSLSPDGSAGEGEVAIDGSTFKAVNNRDRNFTRGKIDRRRAQLEESVARYLSQLDTADRQEPSDVLVLKTTRLKEKLDKLKEEMGSHIFEFAGTKRPRSRRGLLGLYRARAGARASERR